jgi:hypothetical protein
MSIMQRKEIQGVIVYQDISGGFWGILGDDGQKYAPESLPDTLRQEGLRVKATVQTAPVMSVRMWGLDVIVESVERMA